jgi:transposase-like protein
VKDITYKNADHIALSDNGVLMPLNLPPTNTIRWVASRKAQVVAAVHAQALSMDEACRRYRLSPQEFREWERHYKADGVKGLRVSARQHQPRALQ